jgi:hypothetical protein
VPGPTGAGDLNVRVKLTAYPPVPLTEAIALWVVATPTKIWLTGLPVPGTLVVVAMLGGRNRPAIPVIVPPG